MTELLHFPISQPSRAVSWFMKNHNIDIKHTLVDIMKGATNTPEFREINLFQSIPVLKLEDGTYLSESSAILNYLATKFTSRNEYPDDALLLARIHEAQLRHDNLARLATTHALRPCLARMRNPALTSAEIREKIEAGSEPLKWALQALDGIFAKQSYIAGNTLSVADYNVICELNQLPGLDSVLPDDLKVSAYPNIARYLDSAKLIPNHDEFLAPFLAAAKALAV